MVSFADTTVVGRGGSNRKERTANQLVLTSPVAKKFSIDRPIRTESTESVTDKIKITGVTGFLSIPSTKA